MKSIEFIKVLYDLYSPDNEETVRVKLVIQDDIPEDQVMLEIFEDRGIHTFWIEPKDWDDTESLLIFIQTHVTSRRAEWAEADKDEI